MIEIKGDFGNAAGEMILRPNRSLRPGQIKFFNLMSDLVLGGTGLFFGLKFGAWPVTAFNALMMGGLHYAFHRNAKSGLEHHTLRLSDKGLEIETFDPHRQQSASLAALNPQWVRIETEARGIAIKSGVQTFRIGHFLPPKELKDASASLKQALRVCV